MSQKRSLYKMIFGNKPQNIPSEHTQLKMLSGYTPMFSTFGSEAYDSDDVRSSVDAIARNCAKLKPKHIIKTKDKVETPGSQLEYLLAVRPNQYMDSYTFHYKVVTQLFLSNNAFIYIDYDKIGNIKGLYPIHAANVEWYEGNGEIYLKFNFLGGETVMLPYSEMIHLRRHFYKADLVGESNSTALNPLLQLITTVNDGIVNSIKSSGFIRGILKFTNTMMKPSDMKAERDRFVTEYLGIDNNGGIGAVDGKAEFIPMKLEPQTVDDKRMVLISQKICKYFGISEKIITSSYDENEWNAFYESTIEPLSIQLGLEISYKVFSDNERKAGNEIIYESSRLQYASNTTKVNLIKETMAFGILTVNEAREIFNLAPVANGDTRMQTLNVVNADKADNYQGVGGDNNNAKGNQNNDGGSDPKQ